VGTAPAGQPLLPGGSEEDVAGEPQPEPGPAPDGFDPESFGPLSAFLPANLAALEGVAKWSLDHLKLLGETEGLRWYCAVLALAAGTVAFGAANRKKRPDGLGGAGSPLWGGAAAL
jgi:hypothetical protein